MTRSRNTDTADEQFVTAANNFSWHLEYTKRANQSCGFCECSVNKVKYNQESVAQASCLVSRVPHLWAEGSETV
ncbi:hypothetical protein V5799_023085 [Amblyomma americanum]|uniref:Uncharacterized protein n=1 Tax=Amblyomma americanum TaxID=6943 RepID=A0AAQ4FJ01_AMBAM